MTTTPRGQGGGRGTVHGDLSQMAEPRRLNGMLYYGVLLVAAGIDIATFYQVLALVMRNVPDQVVWLGVVGFTVTALSLAHTMGVRIRDRIDNGGRSLGSASAWLLFVIWLFVGITAFVVRLVAPAQTTSGGTTIVIDGEPISAPSLNAGSPMLAAMLFLALYLATGTVAAIAGYLRHNTAAKQYAMTLRTRASLARVAASSAADLALAQQTKVALDEERRRREEGWLKAQEEWHAIARRLKQEARLRLASAAQNPSTTDAYFVPPEHNGRPISGAPVSGMPVGTAPLSGAPRPGSGGAPAYPAPAHPSTPVHPEGRHQPEGQVYQAGRPYLSASAYSGPTSVPAAPPAIGDQAPPWRLNANPGAQRSPSEHDSAVDPVRWDGGR